MPSPIRVKLDDFNRLTLPKSFSGRISWLTSTEPIEAWLMLIASGRYRLVADEQVGSDPFLSPIRDWVLGNKKTDGVNLAAEELALVPAQLLPVLISPVSSKESRWRLTLPKIFGLFADADTDVKDVVVMFSLEGYPEIWFTGTLRRAAARFPDASALVTAARQYSPMEQIAEQKWEWDVFISHANEDKDEIARPLAQALRSHKLKVWYDEFSLKVGDSLRTKIDEGLAGSRFGIVILSPQFFKKDWTEKELNGLASREVNKKKVILPVWHEVDVDVVRRYSPLLADRRATWTNKGLNHIVTEILNGMGFRIEDNDTGSEPGESNKNDNATSVQQPVHQAGEIKPQTEEQLTHESIIRVALNRAAEGAETIVSPQATIMCSGFNRRKNNQIIFEAEVPIKIRLRPRVWHYRNLADNSKVQTANRWRVEIVVDAKQEYLRPQHVAIVAQMPYSSRWVQKATFKKYSRDQSEFTIVSGLKSDEDPVDWLERNIKYDPWEKRDRYVAGISFPHESYGESRNTDGDFIFGACPDFEEIVEILFKADDIQHMLDQTQKNKIVFWNQGPVKRPPRLYPEVIDEATVLMWLSIQQALAGPVQSHEKWLGQPVSKLIRFIYCNHLNARNRTIARRRRYEDFGYSL